MEMEQMQASFTITLERPSPEDVEGLLRIQEMLDRNRARLRDRLDAMDRQREEIRLLVEFATSAGEPMSSDDNPFSGTATVQDIMHCQTQREASYVIAEKNGGPIDLKSAARVIMAAGLSKGMEGTIVSSLHNFMGKSADWRYAGPSRFELLARREGAPESSLGPDSGDEESSTADVSEVGPRTLSTYKGTAA